MRKRRTMALAAGAVVAAMVPGVALAEVITPDAARAIVYQPPDVYICFNFGDPEPVVDPRTGTEYPTYCAAIDAGVRVMLKNY